MAQRTVTILADDIDGREASDIETVTFSFDGATYEIDLSKKNRAAMTKALAPYISASRKTSPTRRRASSGSRARATAQERECLRSNGFPDVKDRGRLSTDAIQALKSRRG